MKSKGSKDNPCLLGEIIRVIKDYLFMSHQYMCDKLAKMDSKGDGSQLDINTISAWVTSKHAPSRNNCRKITELFIEEIKEIKDKEKTSRLSAYLKYCISESDVKELFKKEIIAITYLEKLVEKLISIAKYSNIILKPFVPIDDIPKEELEKYYTIIIDDKPEDSSINISSKNNPNITLPPTKPQFLVGRENSLAKLDQMGDKVLLINGLGGIGKTELCKAYFWEKYNDYDNIGWIDYNLGIKESIVNQVQTNMTFSEDTSLDDKYKSILLYLCNLKSCLLIIDNINNPDDENLNDIARFPFRVIANSRLNCGSIFTPYVLEFLDKESCKELFCKYYKNISDEDIIYIEKIIKISGYHTLTIELLAKQCKSSGITVKELYDVLTDHGLSLEGIKELIKVSINNDAKESKRLIDHLQTLFQIFKVEDDKERYILSNLSVLPSLDILKKDIKEWLGLESLEKVNSLVDKGWINERDGQVKMHEVISEVVRNSDIRPSLVTCDNLMQYYVNFLKYDDKKGDPYEKSAYIFLGESILKYFNEDTLIIALLAKNIAGIYMWQGRYTKAEPLYKRALKIREHVLGPKHPDTANSLNNLALLYNNQGKYEEAEPLYKRALEIREEVLGPIHYDTANSLNNLALLYNNQGKYEEAEPLYKRALEISEEVLGPNHSDTVIYLSNLGGLYRNQGKYEKAEPLYKRALKIREEILGPKHHYTANSLNNLAALYDNQGKCEEAEPLYKRALEISEEVLRPNHPDTATTLNNLAALYDKQGKYEEAEPLYKRALEIREEVLGSKHPYTANSLNNLAALYEKQGKYEEAEPLYKRALEIGAEVLGPKHPNTATYLSNLALLYKKQGKYEVLFKTVEQIFGDNEPKIADLIDGFARLFEKLLVTNDPDTATSLDNLAALYLRQGKSRRAVTLYKRALKIRKQVLGPKHPDTANSLNTLGAIYHIQAKHRKAEFF